MDKVTPNFLMKKWEDNVGSGKADSSRDQSPGGQWRTKIQTWPNIRETELEQNKESRLKERRLERTNERPKYPPSTSYYGTISPDINCGP